MSQLGLGAGAAAVGALVVGPVVSHAILRWVGWRVAVPLVLGYVPGRRELGSARVRCRRCEGSMVGAGVPALSWLAIAGRCPHCREPLAAWVAAVEIVTGLAFGVTAWRIGWSPALVPVLLLVTGMVAVSVVDLAYWRIPARFVYFTTAAVSLAMAVAAVGAGVPGSLAGAAWGGSVYFGLLALLHLISPRMLGFGDVRLALPMGLVVGWMTWSDAFPVTGPLSGILRAAFFGSLVGVVVGVALLVVRRRSEPYPFGPWLSLGALVTILLAAPGPV